MNWAVAGRVGERLSLLWIGRWWVIFLGSLLLFLIQPIVAQRLLPVWGGSPAVWLTCMMFFQGCLLLGYSWVWLISRWSSYRGQALATTMLLLVTWWCLFPLDLAPVAPLDYDRPTLDILWFLATGLGLPTIVLATTSPLLQNWIAAARQSSRRTYRWFAVSNLASLVALLSYPVGIQPLWGLQQQIALWSWGFFLFGVAMVANALWAWRRLGMLQAGQAEPPKVGVSETAGQPPQSAAGSGQAPVAEERPRRVTPDWIWWLALSFGPSVLLMAVSNQMSSDIAAGPLLWVVPLGLYLLTFTIAFARPGLDRHAWLWCTAALGSVVLLASVSLVKWLPAWVLGIGLCGGLFTLTLLAHASLVDRQPPTQRLPMYYWMIAAGGWLGGLAVGLVAPLVFSHYYELELAVLGCWGMCLLSARGQPQAASRATGQPRQPRQGRRARMTAVLMATALIVIGSMLGLIAKYPRLVPPDREGLLVQQRTFFGVLTVGQLNSPHGTKRYLGHGSTDHGRQLVDGPWARLPAGYYHPGSGLSAAFQELRHRRPARELPAEELPAGEWERREFSSGGLEVAVMGLGAGHVVHWGQHGDRFVFYEIDPLVVQLAETYFPSRLSAAATSVVRVADGRLGLQADRLAADEDFAGWDLIVMDAFTGDAVPTHLLTREAWQLYLGCLAENGVVAVHISNRYVDLRPVLDMVAIQFDLQQLEVDQRHLGRGRDWRAERVRRALPPTWLSDTMVLLPLSLVAALGDIDVDPRPSHWVLLSRQSFSSPTLKGLGARGGQQRRPPLLWTDDDAPLWPLLQ